MLIEFAKDRGETRLDLIRSTVKMPFTLGSMGLVILVMAQLGVIVINALNIYLSMAV